MNGDQNRYFMKCPHCKEMIHFSFLNDGFQFEYDKESYELTSDVVFVCQNGCKIEEYQKFEMMKRENGAKYIPLNPSYKNKLKKTVFIPTWYSPFVTWRELIEKYLSALKDKEQRGKSDKLKVWWNTIEGYIFDDESEKAVETTADELMQRREEYTKVPSDVVLLSAGVDTQGFKPYKGLSSN